MEYPDCIHNNSHHRLQNCDQLLVKVYFCSSHRLVCVPVDFSGSLRLPTCRLNIRVHQSPPLAVIIELAGA